MKNIKGQYMFNGILLYNDNYESYVFKNENSKTQKLVKIKGLKTINRLDNVPVVSTIVYLISHFIYFFKMFGLSMEYINSEIKSDIKRNKETSKIIDISKKFDIYLTDIILIISIPIGLILSILFFGLLPWLIFKMIIYYTNAYLIAHISVAIYKISLLFFLILFSSKIKEIEKIYMYHTAKHRIDECLKNNKEITLHNIKTQKSNLDKCNLTLFFASYVYAMILFSITELYMIGIQGIFKLFLTITIYLFLSYLKNYCYNTKIYNILIFPAKPFLQQITKNPNDEIIDVILTSYNLLTSVDKNNQKGDS